MSKTTTTTSTTTTPPTFAAPCAADRLPQRGRVTSASSPSIYIHFPPQSSSSSVSNYTEMSSKHTTVHDEWASPIPQSALRNSLSLHRPPFVHSNTNYHASSSTSSLPLASNQPYKDNESVPSTKEEYPSGSGGSSSSNSNPTTNPYAQVFPPRSSGSARRQPHSGHARQSSFGAWDSVSCRLLEWKCRMCSKEGALGRGLMVGWVITTVGFLLACAFWKGELFTALDDLSKELYSLGYQGQLIFGFLIFITTIPPLPLYSTLMVLCGYTFGVWEAFVVSYIASLVGAVVVFVVSRTLLRDVITKSLQNSPTAMSLLHIIPSKPHLLLLIRVAPYPYNLLNVILASSPCLSLRTYTACTALSLCKLVLHTWIGAGLHDLSELHGTGGGTGKELSAEDQQRQDVRWYSTCFGVVLCISLFFYLTHLAKRAVAKAQTEHEAREVRCPGQGHVFLREEDA